MTNNLHHRIKTFFEPGFWVSSNSNRAQIFTMLWHSNQGKPLERVVARSIQKTVWILLGSKLQDKEIVSHKEDRESLRQIVTFVDRIPLQQSSGVECTAQCEKPLHYAKKKLNLFFNFDGLQRQASR